LPVDINKFIRYLQKDKQIATSPLNIESPDDEKKRTEQAFNNLHNHLVKQAQLKGAAVDSIEKNKDNYYVNKDPYSTGNKIQFEEAFRADGIVRRALLRKADFVFAKGIKTVLDTMDDDFQDFQKKQEAISGIITKKEYTDAKSQIDKINRKLNFRHYFRGCYLKCNV